MRPPQELNHSSLVTSVSHIWELVRHNPLSLSVHTIEGVIINRLAGAGIRINEEMGIAKNKSARTKFFWPCLECLVVDEMSMVPALLQELAETEHLLHNVPRVFASIQGQKDSFSDVPIVIIMGDMMQHTAVMKPHCTLMKTR